MISIRRIICLAGSNLTVVRSRIAAGFRYSSDWNPIIQSRRKSFLQHRFLPTRIQLTEYSSITNVNEKNSNKRYKTPPKSSSTSRKREGTARSQKVTPKKKVLFKAWEEKYQKLQRQMASQKSSAKSKLPPVWSLSLSSSSLNMKESKLDSELQTIIGDAREFVNSIQTAVLEDRIKMEPNEKHKLHLWLQDSLWWFRTSWTDCCQVISLQKAISSREISNECQSILLEAACRSGQWANAFRIYNEIEEGMTSSSSSRNKAYRDYILTLGLYATARYAQQHREPVVQRKLEKSSANATYSKLLSSFIKLPSGHTVINLLVFF
jgi:hypothetical protein